MSKQFNMETLFYMFSAIRISKKISFILVNSKEAASATWIVFQYEAYKFLPMHYRNIPIISRNYNLSRISVTLSISLCLAQLKNI